MTKKNMKAYALIIIALLAVAICVVFATQHRKSKSTLSAEGVNDTSSEIAEETEDTKEKYSVPPIILTEGPKETAKPSDTEVITDEEGSTKYVQQNVPQDFYEDVYVTDETEVTPQEDTPSPEETKEPEQTTQTTAVTTQPKPVKTNSLGLPVEGTHGQELYGNDGNLYAWDDLFKEWCICGDGGGALTMSPEQREDYENTPHYILD